MTLSMTEPSAAHRAALALHALAAPDRDWMLEALGEEQRQRLRPLLRELEELSIPRDGSLLETLAASAPAEPGGAAHGLGDLTGAQVRKLAELLAGEPPRLVAVLLASRAWPWRAQLLASLPAEVAHVLAQPAQAGRPPEALQASVMAHVARALAESGAEAAPRGWPRLRARLAAMRRKR